MAKFYQVTLANANREVFVNMEKVEAVSFAQDSTVYITMTSGQTLETTRASYESALVASGSDVFEFKGKEATVNDYDALDTTDVEDVTDLSDGTLVREGNLEEPRENAQVEGSIAVDEADDIDPKDVVKVIQELGLDSVSATDIANIAAVMRATKNL